jgi:amino acid transporter
MGLFPALAANMLQMVGVGPFLTIPLILAAMGGPQALAGWVLGAVISACDGLVWAELGAAMPGTGGSYEYLQQAFGPRGLGRLMGFLFLWQVMLSAPITAASGGLGFADYARYLFPGMSAWEHRLVAVAVCAAATVLLYRNIRSISTISTVLWIGLMLAMGIIVWGGATHFHPAMAFTFPRGAFHLSGAFFTGLGTATLLAMYDYSGYFTVCLIGGEVKNPARTIPRAVLYSIAILAVLYVAMSLSVIGVVPWQEAAKSQAVMSVFMERLYGAKAASAMTVLILWVAFASVFCVLLGYTRVPYAAAAEGKFFRVFARVHPKEHFPSFSVLFMGVLSAAACFFTLEQLIKELIILQILTWFAAQCVAVVLIRKLRKEIRRPFSMPLYPIPVLAALGGWLYILIASEQQYVWAGLAMVVVGTGAYLWRARRLREWPFGERSQLD